jgi:excisionase family DNA binding protein
MATLPKVLIQFLNEHDLAELLGVKVSTVRRWRQSHRGPRYVKYLTSVRYSRDDVMAWLKSRPSGGEAVEEGR